MDIAVEELGYVWPGTTIGDETGPDGKIRVTRRWLGLDEAMAEVVPREGRYAIESESYDYGLGNRLQFLVVALIGLAAGVLVWRIGLRTVAGPSD